MSQERGACSFRPTEASGEPIFVGTTRIASKLSPGESAVTGDTDPWMVTLGKWYLHRSDSGLAHASNTDHNPHYRIDSRMPRGGMAEDNFVYFYHPDHLGSTAYVTNAAGDLYEHEEYFPSGEPWVSENSDTEDLPYLFSGKQLDQETGLYDFGARQYDPRVGLFLSTDPMLEGYLDGTGSIAGVFLPENLSLYAYGLQNPLRYLDPQGRDVLSTLEQAAIRVGEREVLVNPALLTTAAVVIGIGAIASLPSDQPQPFATVSQGYRPPVRRAVHRHLEGASAHIVHSRARSRGRSRAKKKASSGRHARPAEHAAAGGQEHTSGARPSTRERHEAGRTRAARDRGRERADRGRRRPRRRPKGHKGPWP